MALEGQGESGDGDTPTKSVDHPKKKSILKKDAMNKEETERLLRGGVQCQDEPTSDTAASPPLQRQTLFKPLSSPAASGAAASCPPKLNPPPKASRPSIRLQAAHHSTVPQGGQAKVHGSISDNGSSSPPCSRESAAAAAASSPSLLKPGCHVNSNDVSTGSETADARRNAPTSNEATPDETMDNLINSFGGPALDDSKIAFIDEQSPVDNIK